MSGLECPYCNAPNEVCHDDGQGYEEGRSHEMTCNDCGKNFVFQTSINYCYSPEKADCLNGSPHRFSKWQTLWDNDQEIVQRRICQDCDRREPEVTIRKYI